MAQRRKLSDAGADAPDPQAAEEFVRAGKPKASTAPNLSAEVLKRMEKRRKAERVQLNIRIPIELSARIAVLADREDKPQNDVAIEALESWCSGKGV